jgi:peroxiredoxin
MKLRLASVLLTLATPGLALAAGAAAAPAVTAAAALGKPAPDFSLTDTEGKTVKLSDFHGKTVVLEWFNPGCPFVKYAHGKGPLEAQGNAATDKGVVWLGINSGAPGKQGAGAEQSAAGRKTFAMNYPVLVDESGSVGKLYGARSTPHMFVIDGAGNLVYRGAIDNAPMGEADGAPVNYVEAALADLAAGKAVAKAETKSYGCSVKYAD